MVKYYIIWWCVGICSDGPMIVMVVHLGSSCRWCGCEKVYLSREILLVPLARAWESQSIPYPINLSIFHVPPTSISYRDYKLVCKLTAHQITKQYYKIMASFDINYDALAMIYMWMIERHSGEN